jgi:hypothetical protein
VPDRASAIGCQEHRRSAGPAFILAIQKGRPEAAAVIAAHRPFDLDHFGAEIAEYLRGPGPGKHAAEIDDT